MAARGSRSAIMPRVRWNVRRRPPSGDSPWQATARVSRRQRDWLKAAATLIVVAIVVGYWWQSRQSPDSQSPGTALGTVVQSHRDDGRLDLTVSYTVAGTTHETTGAVDAARFRTDGKTVWVCYDLGSPGDTDETRLRLPTDDLCAQGPPSTE